MERKVQFCHRPDLVRQIHVRIDPGGSDAGVPQQFLYRKQICPAADEIGAVSMPQLVRRQIPDGHLFEECFVPLVNAHVR